MDKKLPQPFLWTPESITDFWDLLSHSPLMRFSFGTVCGQAALHDLKQQIAPNETILDFGAGDGEIAELLLQQGYKVAVYEPSTGRNAAIAAKNLEQYSNFCGHITNEQTSQSTFDIVLIFEVLEHIHPICFKQTLENIVAHLTPAGKIMGTVPDNEHLEDAYCVCPQCGSMFHRWQHMRSFTKESLKRTLQDINMKNISIARVSYAPSLFFVASAITE